MNTEPLLLLVLVTMLLETQPERLIADAEVAGLLSATEVSKIEAFLVPIDPKSPTIRKFRPIPGFGIVLEGQVFTDGNGVRSVNLWAQDHKLAPNRAIAVFSRIKDVLSAQLGEGRLIANIPNYQDGSAFHQQAIFWALGDQVLLLTVTRYSKRAGVDLIRQDRAAWLSEMGADTGEFWKRTLDNLESSTSIEGKD